MTDYKGTLNLPKTQFPMKANLSQREPDILKSWQSMDLYQQQRQQAQGCKTFILHDGPIYANGNIHVGHAQNRILKDIVLKSKRMSGFDAPFVPGWDCHGLPIEINVEKKVGKAGIKVDMKTFRQHCRDYAKQQIAKQGKDFQRLGVLADWQQPYLTMDYQCEANTIRAFKQIITKGYLRQGFKPVHWCFNCQSSLAEAEVIYKDKQSPSIDVRFPVQDKEQCLKLFGVSTPIALPICVVIWTTTPWTLPANRAVALHPDLDYALVQIKHECIIIAKSMIADIMARYGIKHYQLIAYCHGRDLTELSLLHPFYQRMTPILLADHVTIDTGTGAVHTAPSHGEDDYRLGKQYGLPVDNLVAANGCYTNEVELFAGQHVFQANAKILEILKQRGMLVHEMEIEHSYPHCWRHKTPIIFRATPQWFIRMDNGLLQQAIQSLTSVKWIPRWGEKRMVKMLENRPDWCISRQRTWGVPIPLFMHKDTRALHPKTEQLLEQIALRVERQGIDAWFDLKAEELLADEAQHYQKITDVLDVWFDSGATHYTILNHREGLHSPADLYLEGPDQHRGWFQTSLLTSIAIYQQSPYHQLLTHCYVVDADGGKMSKSVGNVVTPDTICKTLGADILRLWVASTDYMTEVSVSDESFRRTSDTYRRIRNTARFLLANLHDFDPKTDILNNNHMLALDNWIVDTAYQVQQQVITAYDHYQFHHVVQAVHHFCAIELGSFYLDIIKDRQYTCKTQSIARRSAQTAIYHIIQALVRWIAPVLSFTADEIWSFLPDPSSAASVHLSQWYNHLTPLYEDTQLDNPYWQQLMTVRDAVNKELEIKRNANVIGSSLEAEVTLYAHAKLYEQLLTLGEELRFILITSNAKVVRWEQRSADAANTEIENLAVKVQKSSGRKCSRCWHRQHDVGTHQTHPDLCERCINNIEGIGEQRHFA